MELEYMEFRNAYYGTKCNILYFLTCVLLEFDGL